MVTFFYKCTITLHMKRIALLSRESFIEVLTKKDLKPINDYLKTHFGVQLENGFAYLLSTKNNLYMVTRQLQDVDIKRLRISSIGLYIGEWRKEELRFSIEGSQLLGHKASKSIIDLSSEEVGQWMRGQPLNKITNETGYVLVRHNKDYLGCGRVKDGSLLNFVPKTRWVKELA